MDCNATLPASKFCYDFAETQNTRRGNIAGLSITNGLNTHFPDVIGGEKIWLAELKMNNVTALGFQSLSARQNSNRASPCDRARSSPSPLW